MFSETVRRREHAERHTQEDFGLPTNSTTHPRPPVTEGHLHISECREPKILEKPSSHAAHACSL